MNTNFTIKLLGSACLLLAATFTSQAAFLSPEASLRRAQNSNGIRKIPGNAQFTLAHTQRENGESFLYVFNKGEQGFIVTSADDSMPALLGYSDNGAFDYAKASPEIKWWLGQYAAQAEAALKSGNVMLSSSPATRSEKATIPEMLTTRWDQDSPYNLDCPTDKGGRCVTGCVATAMAQVIKYHGYPVNGNGTASYKWNGQTLSFDYSTANFDYQNMLDEYPYYNDNSTKEQKEAVAKLMYACGVGVQMQYTSQASGAIDIYIPYALKEYFNYDKNIQYLQRDYFTAEDWDDIVYAELEAGRPVIYGGQSNDGGHEFVCDGYDGGYFHINWGWSGYYNGWFLLSALDPEGQGIGGGDGGFNYDQSIISGVQPNAGNPGVSYPLYATGGLEVITTGYNYGKLMAQVGITAGGVWNYSPEIIETSFYLKAVSPSGDEYVSDAGDVLTFQAATDRLSGFTRFNCYVPSAPEGKYKVYLQYMGPQGELVPLMMPLSSVSYLNMTVDASGNVSFSEGEPDEKASIVVTEFSPVSTVVSGEDATYKIAIKNTGNVTYSGDVYLKTYQKGSEEELNSLGIEIAVSAGQSISGTIDYNFNLPDGEYDVRFYNMYGDLCSDVFSFVIGTQEVEPTSIALNITEKTLVEGDSFTLTATVSPEYATDKSVTWSSSDESVASVRDGIVTAITPGTAVITASTANGLTADCSVTVTAKPIEAAGITLDATEKTVTEGDTFTLTATIDPENTSDKTISWTSSNADVAIVEDGVVTAIAPGSAVITAATSNGLTASCSVIVNAKVIEAVGITLDVTEKTLIEGDSFTLNATIDPENCSDKTITWTSSNTEVATVEEGVVKAIAPGSAVITAATSNGLTASCTVTVEEDKHEAKSISLNYTSKTITEGESFFLTAKVEPEDALDKSVTWTTTDSEVATVDDGYVLALTPGLAIIKATTSNGLSASCVVNVEPKPIEATGITLDVTEKTLIEGETIILTATVEPADATDSSVTWSSSNTAVATVNDGVVTAVAPGSAIITAATANGLTATCTVTVNAKVIDASAISLDASEKTLTEGDSFTLTATVSPENATDKSIIWTSSDAAVASVADGVVTAVAPGTAVITASTSNGLSATCTVTVEKKFIYATSISLDKTSIEAEVGETIKLEATVLPDDATEKKVAWSSTDESVATVDQEGNVTIISTGIATIIAATTDGSDLQAECVISGVSYVEAIVIEAGNVDVYTLDGVLLRKKADASYVSNLAKGTYIIRTPSKTLKLVK